MNVYQLCVRLAAFSFQFLVILRLCPKMGIPYDELPSRRMEQQA